MIHYSIIEYSILFMVHIKHVISQSLRMHSREEGSTFPSCARKLVVTIILKHGIGILSDVCNSEELYDDIVVNANFLSPICYTTVHHRNP